MKFCKAITLANLFCIISLILSCGGITSSDAPKDARPDPSVSIESSGNNNTENSSDFGDDPSIDTENNDDATLPVSVDENISPEVIGDLEEDNTLLSENDSEMDISINIFSNTEDADNDKIEKIEKTDDDSDSIGNTIEDEGETELLQGGTEPLEESNIPTYILGGTVRGLYGTLIIQDNEGNHLELSSNGRFTFVAPINENSSYDLSVQSQPLGQTCIITDGSGFVEDANTASVEVNCSLESGHIFTVVGGRQAEYSGDGGLASNAMLNSPFAIAFDSLDNLYIADTHNFRVRKIDKTTGVISTFAGDGTPGKIIGDDVTPEYLGDSGLAINAKLNCLYGMAFDSLDNLYVTGCLRVRKIDSITGIITTVAGNGERGDSGGVVGLATDIVLGSPFHLAVDSEDNLYIADSSYYRVRKVDMSTGIITTVAGTGNYNYSGDGGLATSASIGFPSGLAFDSEDNLYIADGLNQRIRRVDTATGIITKFAGVGRQDYSGDGGQATSASFCNPVGLAFDASDNLFFAEDCGNRVRRIDKTTGIITKVAGADSSEYYNGYGEYRNGGYSGDGDLATNAQLNSPQSIAFDSFGNIYIADHENNRVRMVAK